MRVRKHLADGRPWEYEEIKRRYVGGETLRQIGNSYG